jgi:hypothetical protein
VESARSADRPSMSPWRVPPAATRERPQRAESRLTSKAPDDTRRFCRAES